MQDGRVEAIRLLFVARRSAFKARAAVQVQIKTLLVTEPEQIRQKYRTASDKDLITGLAGTRGSNTDQVIDATGHALRFLASQQT